MHGSLSHDIPVPEQTKTRSIKILLIWQDGRTLKYFRLIDITPIELETLRTIHGHLAFSDQYITGTVEYTLRSVARWLGQDSYLMDGLSDEEFKADPEARKWQHTEIQQDQVAGFMGWDRVFVSGFSED